MNNQGLYFKSEETKYIFYFAFGSTFFLTFVRMKKQEFLESLLRADFCSKRYFIY